MMGLFGGGGAGMVAMLAMALIWVSLALLVIWGVARFFPHERRSEREIAREVIARRYAAGEITEAEYLNAQRALGYN